MERFFNAPARGRPKLAEVDLIARKVADHLSRVHQSPDPVLWSVEAAASYLGMQKSTLYNEVSRQNQGRACLKIPYIKIGRSLRFCKTALDAWLESRQG